MGHQQNEYQMMNQMKGNGTNNNKNILKRTPSNIEPHISNATKVIQEIKQSRMTQATSIKLPK